MNFSLVIVCQSWLIPPLISVPLTSGSWCETLGGKLILIVDVARLRVWWSDTPSRLGVVEENTKLGVIPSNSQELQRLNHNTNHVADARLRANYSTAVAPRGHGRNSDPLHAQPHQRDSGIWMLNLLQMLTVGFHQDTLQGECHQGRCLRYGQQNPNRPAAVTPSWSVP